MSELQSDPWANSKHSDIHSTVSSQTTFLVFCLSRWTAKGAPAGEQHHKASCVPYHRCVHGWPGFTPQSKARWGTWDSSSSRSWSEIPREQTNSSGILSILFGFPPFMSFYAKRDKVTERQSRSNVISSHCTFRGLNSDFRTRSLVSLVPSSKQKWKITDTEQNPPSEDPKQTSVLIYSLTFFPSVLSIICRNCTCSSGWEYNPAVWHILGMSEVLVSSSQTKTQNKTKVVGQVLRLHELTVITTT